MDHDEIKEENIRLLEVYENENMTYQNLWDTAKAFLRGKFIAVIAYIKKTERSQKIKKKKIPKQAKGKK
jgi:hypothetical protein